jgi:Calcineurin-like phosphoesterase
VRLYIMNIFLDTFLVYLISIFYFSFTILYGLGPKAELISLYSSLTGLRYRMGQVRLGPVRLRYENENFSVWYAQCKKLPFKRDVGEKYQQSAIPSVELVDTITAFIKVQVDNLTRENTWLKDPPGNATSFLRSTQPLHPIQPFVQKLIINPGTVIAFRGDLHGDIHSLLEFVKSLQDEGYLNKDNGFVITNKNDFYIIVLGDYVDRGLYGTEVWYTLMRLKIENPHNVFMLRGNHEDTAIASHYGFEKEFREKFQTLRPEVLTNFYNLITRLFDFLPVALYLGCGISDKKDFLQCCHGGMEIGFDPKELLDLPLRLAYQWLGGLYQTANAKKWDLPPQLIKDLEGNKDYSLRDLSAPQVNMGDIGFVWNDFRVGIEERGIIPSLRGHYVYQYDTLSTFFTLKRSSSVRSVIKGVFRAHQHSGSLTPMMKSLLHRDGKDMANEGLSKLWTDSSNTGNKLWDGIVCTFLAAPDCGFGIPNPPDYDGYTYDAYALLTTAANFDDWRLEVKRNTIYK